MITDFAWLIEESDDVLAKYAGKWIAVSNREIVAVGDTAIEAADRAREKAPHSEFLLEHVLTPLDIACVHP